MASASDKAAKRARLLARAGERFAVCKTNACNAFHANFKGAETCAACGCMLRLKVLHPGEKCPQGRW